MTKAEVLNAFLDAALNCVTREIKSPVQRGILEIDPSDHVTDEVTIYVAFVGQVRGMLLLGMARSSARHMAGSMIGEPQAELNELGLSALAELGNVIAGRASIELERMGYPCDITPPTIMIGRKSRLTTLGLPRFVIPLSTIYGSFNVHVAVELC